MNPELKFHSIVISLTTGIVFFIWICLNSIITAYPVFSVILSALISLGIYKSLALLILTFFRNIKVIKRFILGPRFLEGTWVGFFVGNQNKIRFFAETFEQELNKTVIRGRVFREDGSYHGSWIANDVNIDEKLGKLSYHYETDAIGNTFINPGIAYFNFERLNNNKPPFMLIGFSSDLFSPYKSMSFEEKFSDDTSIGSSLILENAKKVYEKHKNHIS